MLVTGTCGHSEPDSQHYKYIFTLSTTWARYHKDPEASPLNNAGMIRGRELKTLILPKIVEARKRVESDMDSPNSTLHCQHLSRSSTLSDSTSPTTPTLSARGHSRLPSSTSSLASSPTMRESIDGYGSAKRPLTDVREEPQDKEEDYEMINGFDGRRSYEGN